MVYAGRKELMDEDKVHRAGDLRAHAHRGHRRRRRVPRPVGRRRAQGGHGQEDGGPPADPRPGQPEPGDLAGRRQGGAPRLRIATGRTDYPNQVNNVLVFPYIFRGALDSGATTITVEMEIAAVYALAELAQAESSGGRGLCRREAVLRPRVPDPEAFDPRLMIKIAPAVAKAAADSGVARARSRTWTPTASSCKASSTPPARP